MNLRPLGYEAQGSRAFLAFVPLPADTASLQPLDKRGRDNLCIISVMAIFAYLFRVDPEKWAEFMEAARMRGTTAKWMLESFIDDFLAKERAKKKKKKGKDTDA